jgi:hypothetical protein
MTASLEERLLPILIMLIASMISAIIPLYALRRHRLNFQRDIFFIFFWFQSWIYLHLVPTLNVMFPESAFAVPPRSADLRMIHFTNEEVILYAFFQLLLLVLFYLPMIFIYMHKLRIFSGVNLQKYALLNSAQSCRRIPFNRLRNIENHKNLTSFNRLFILCLFYSSLGIIYSIVAIKTGILNAYAVDIDIFITMNQFDRFIWRIYHLSALLILVILLLAYFERQWSSKCKSILIIVAMAPGIIIQVINNLIGSRGEMIFAIFVILIVLYIRGHIKKSKKSLTVIIISSSIIIFYSFIIIPNLRGVVLDPLATSDNYFETLNPFSSDTNKLLEGFGMRADGIDLMVLATPYLLNQGFVPFSWYAITLINPFLPLFPEIEKKMKIDENISDFKQRYLGTYTPATTTDYNSVSFTELFMVMGPLGFIIAGVFFSIVMKWTNRMIYKDNYYVLGGLFLMFQIISFESSISSALTGWIRILPIYLIILIFNPWSKNNFFTRIA